MSRTNIEKVKEERSKIYKEYFSNRLLSYVLGSNELIEACYHAEEGSGIYKFMLYGVKISRKIYKIFSFSVK